MTNRIPYADTSVPPERSQAAIQKMLYEHGAQGLQWTEVSDQVELKFVIAIDGKPMTVRVRPAMLVIRKREYGRRGSTQTMVSKAATLRLLFFWLKSTLEAVRYGLVSFQEAFLAHVVGRLDSGQEVTVGDMLIPRLMDMNPSDLAKALPVGRKAQP